MDPARARWLKERRLGIGASDAAALVGLSRHQSRWSLWAEKVGLLADREPSPRQLVGSLMEPAIDAMFHVETGLYVVGQQTPVIHPEVPWARCTVDGFVVESPASTIDDALGVHEVKTDGRSGWPDGLPPEYRAQVIWQMACTQTEHVWVSVLFARFVFQVLEVHWDGDAERDWQLLHAAGLELWEHVESQTPPEVDGSDATYRALLEVFPDAEVGTRVSLDHLADLLTERAQLKADQKVIEARLDEMRNTLIEAIGDAEVGTLDGEPVLSCRWTDRAGYTVAPTRVRTLRAASRKDRAA